MADVRMRQRARVVVIAPVYVNASARTDKRPSYKQAELAIGTISGGIVKTQVSPTCRNLRLPLLQLDPLSRIEMYTRYVVCR